jgi:hypothetical protein
MYTHGGGFQNCACLKRKTFWDSVNPIFGCDKELSECPIDVYAHELEVPTDIVSPNFTITAFITGYYGLNNYPIA